MATSVLRTALNVELLARGLANSSGVLNAALNRGQIEELCAVCEARGCDVTMLAPTNAAAFDQLVLAPIASQGNTLTVQATVPGTGLATGIVTVQIADNASDALAVTNTAGVILIKLANATDANNTLTLIKAALDLVAVGQYTVVLTGTGSTQMVHGGTNTLAATAAGGTAGTGLKSSAAGVGFFSIKPV